MCFFFVALLRLQNQMSPCLLDKMKAISQLCDCGYIGKNKEGTGSVRQHLFLTCWWWVWPRAVIYPHTHTKRLFNPTGHVWNNKNTTQVTHSNQRSHLQNKNVLSCLLIAKIQKWNRRFCCSHAEMRAPGKKNVVGISERERENNLTSFLLFVCTATEPFKRRRLERGMLCVWVMLPSGYN